VASVVDGTASSLVVASGLVAAEVSWDEVVRSVSLQMRTLVGPIAELEDLTQTALEQVLRAIDRFEGRAELSTFTYRVAANVALKHFRSWRRFFRRFEIGHGPESEDAPSPLVAPDDAMIERERTRRLYRALDRLEPVKRLTLTLADLEELPASQIARILEVPEPTVRSHLRVARQKLFAILARDPLFAPEVAR
jgi:RNA polymerase sigma-70 factor (ECF subfamily)